MSAEPTPALLVVDDEEPVLALVPQLFPGEFPILTARSGEEALARPRARPAALPGGVPGPHGTER